jgi:DNA gyrase subunit B
MNDLILDLGVEGLKFTDISGKKTFTAPQFKDILGSLTELEKLAEILRKRGIPFSNFIQHYDAKAKKLPKYRVRAENDVHFVYDDTELAKLTKDVEDAQYIEIFESKDILEIQQKFEKMGLSLESYDKEDGAAAQAASKGEKKKTKASSTEKQAVLKPLYAIEGEKDQHEFFSLKEVLSFVRAQAQKGMHIQRYKGLGEMNPQQLWDTTMDPARRTILKVALEDAVEVDKTFSMLMGDEVGPRRQFIEANAHEVTNLDI